jgi:DnaJ family protein A protein 5
VVRHKHEGEEEKAKKEYNNKVRGLAQNAKRLDKRVMQMMAKREEERKREMEEARERRKRLKKEKLAKAAMEYEEPEWTKPVERRRKYGDPEEEKEKERDEWECVVCRKGFKSEKQCRNHEQSKKHLRMVAELMELQSKQLNMIAELMEEELGEEVFEEEKRDEVVGESDEFCDNQRESVEVEDDANEGASIVHEKNNRQG